MDDQILNTLRDAENTVAALRTLIESTKNDSGEAPDVPKMSLPENQMFSKDQLYYTKYMTLSTVKLFDMRGSEVFRIPDSVGLYFIVPNTKVRTAARSAVLRIVKIAEEYQDPSHPPAFVQVGDWVYPLMAGSIVYRSEHKYYLFPDLVSPTPGSSVGVILPKSCPPWKRDQFEKLLLSLIELDEFPAQPPQSFGKSTELILSARTSVHLIRTESGVYSQRISDFHRAQRDADNPHGRYGKRIGAGIKAGGEIMSRGLQLGALGTANALFLGTTCLKSALPKAENDADIPSTVVNGVIYAKNVTGQVVQISSAIVNTLRAMTSRLASMTACYIQQSTAPIARKIAEGAGLSPTTIDEVTVEAKDIGEGLLCCSLEAYNGLTSAAQILAEAFSSNTFEIVNHCYGHSAADVLIDAGNVVGNVTMVGMHTDQVTDVGSMIGRTTRQAGLALALDDCSGNLPSMD